MRFSRVHVSRFRKRGFVESCALDFVTPRSQDLRVTPRTGRPLKGDLPVRELERVTIRLDSATKALLLSLAAELRIAAYEVVARAVRAFAARRRSRALPGRRART
jgi:hypothetical protein